MRKVYESITCDCCDMTINTNRGYGRVSYPIRNVVGTTIGNLDLCSKCIERLQNGDMITASIQPIHKA